MGVVLPGFLDVAFLPSRAIFTPHFCGIVVEMKVVRPAHLESVVGDKQGHATCKILLLQQSVFLCHSNLI